MTNPEQPLAGQYLTFAIGGEQYAVGILRVREILQFEQVTRVPTTPAWIRGVMNLRGSVVPVVDLAVKFSLPETVLTPTTCVVIVETVLGEQRAVMGLMADGVSQVVELGPGDVEPAPPFGARIRIDFLLGVARVRDGFALLLDIDRVLNADELLAATTAATPVGGEEATSADGGNA
jgi:purine-binding chemotaxis protein CheW